MVGYFFFDMAVRDACACGITDGRAIYEVGMRLEKERKQKKERMQDKHYRWQDYFMDKWTFEG